MKDLKNRKSRMGGRRENIENVLITHEQLKQDFFWNGGSPLAVGLST
jgi:hypothetical protein